MKKLIAILLFANAAVSAFAVTLPSILDGGTNTYVVAGATNRATVIAAAATNQFNFAWAATQTTNLWPAQGIALVGGRADSRYVNVTIQGSCVASNGGIFVARFGGSTDYSTTVSNIAAITVTMAGTGLFTINTNIDTSALPYLSLYTLENPGPAAVTNLIISYSRKYGL